MYYRQYEELACAIIQDGINQYKKAIREDYDLNVPRKYLNNHFYQTLVRIILNCTVDEMLNEVERNYEYAKYIE